MSVDTFPELTPPVLVVGTLAPGLGPKDVEKTLTWRIEKYVSATPGVEHVESVSRNNLSIVYVWLKWGTDLNSAQTLVQQQVAFAMSAVPKSLGVLPPFVLQYDPSNAPVVQVAVSGGGLTGPQLYDYALNNIEPVLEGIPGVASASINGGRQRQINIVVDPVEGAGARRHVRATSRRRCASRTRSCRRASSSRPTFDANVYTNAVPHAGRDHRRRAREAATTASPVLHPRRRARRGRRRARDAGGLGQRAERRLPERAARPRRQHARDRRRREEARSPSLKDLPPGLKVKPVFDQSTFVRTTYHGLKKEVVQALVLIALVILLFLQSVRGTLIVSVAIPLSFAITLIVLYATGQTLNAFTLGGLTLAMGRLVDDAVVVLESIHRHQRMGLNRFRAALEGTNAVALPVLASTLTTMAVLLPVLLLAGLAKKLFAPLALTVAVAMIASYFVSMCVTPVACRYFLGHAEHGRFGKTRRGVHRRRRRRATRGACGACSRFAATIVGRVAASWSSASGWAATRLPSTFFPEIDESMERVYVRLAPGTSLEDASRADQRDGRDARRASCRTGNVELVLTNVGSPEQRPQRDDQPELRAAHGLHPPRARRPRAAHADASARSPTRYAQILDQALPGRRVPAVAGRPRRERVRQRLHRADRRRGARRQPRGARGAGQGGRRGRARRSPACATSTRRSQMDYPEIRVDTDRAQGRARRRDRARRRPDDARGDARQHQHAERVDRSEQRAVVLRRHLLRRHGGPRPQRAGAAPRARSATTARPCRSAPTRNVRRSVGPIAIERNQLQRAAHVFMQTEGRDIGSVADRARAALAARPAHARHRASTSSARSS